MSRAIPGAIDPRTGARPPRPVSSLVLSVLQSLPHRPLLPAAIRSALAGFDRTSGGTLPAPGTRTALDHLQDVVDLIFGVGFVSGRLAGRWDASADAYRVRGDWRDVDLPTGVSRAWARCGLVGPDRWPPAADSTAAALLLLAMYVGAGDAYEPSRAIPETLTSDWWRPVVEPVWRPRRTGSGSVYFPRKTSWPEIAETDGAALPCDVNAIVHKRHAVILIRRREGLVHPLTRQPLHDHLVVAADGSHRTGRRSERADIGRPLFVELLQTRAARKSRKDKVSIVGIKEPSRISGDLKIIVGCGP